MQGADDGWRGPREVTDDRAVRLLVDAGQVRFLAPFIGRERPASEVARELDVSLDRMLSRLRRLRTAGLVTVTREERRAGRPVKHYRAVADDFYVPLSAVALHRDALRSENYMHGLYARSLDLSLTAALGRLPASGVRVHRRDDGMVAVEAAAAPGVTYDERAPAEPPLVFRWNRLRLDRQTAKNLQAELYDLAERYAARQVDTGTTVVLGACLAPLAEESPGR